MLGYKAVLFIFLFKSFHPNPYAAFPTHSGVPHSIIVVGGGGAHIFIYSCSQTIKTIDFKRNQQCRTRIYEYAPTSAIIEFARPLYTSNIFNIFPGVTARLRHMLNGKSMTNRFTRKTLSLQSYFVVRPSTTAGANNFKRGAKNSVHAYLNGKCIKHCTDTFLQRKNYIRLVPTSFFNRLGHT